MLTIVIPLYSSVASDVYKIPDKPKFIEIEEDHFVLANELEISQYKATGSMMYSLNNEAVGNI